MPRQTRIALIAALVGAGALLTGCSGSGVNAQTLDPPSSTASHSPSSTSTSPTFTPTPPASASSSRAAAAVTSTADAALSARERGDRAAIEAQWLKSWDVYRTLAQVPVDQRKAKAQSVAVDPALSLMLKDAQVLNDKGWDTYGTLGHRISWPKPVNGADEALISDCQDGSHAGSLEIATGTEKTVGVAGAKFQGSMRKGSDGVWRLVQSYYLKDEKC